MTEAEINQALEVVRPKLIKAARALLNGTRQFDVDSAAEDIVQEVMIEAWQKGDLEEWKIRHLLEQRCIDFMRHEDTMAFVKGVDMDTIADVDTGDDRSDIDQEQCKSAALAAFDTLAPVYRRAMLAHYVQGLSCKEISERDGCSLKTVESRIYRALAMVRGKILQNRAVETLSAAA
jgi:RNA polymerase sigma factor (sigma-70 family)